MKRPGLWITIALLALALAAGLWLLSLFERQEATVVRGPTGPARTNPLYTAQRLLETLGLETRAVAFLDDITDPGSRDVILTHTPPALLEGDRLAALLDRVAGGGHLIVAVDRQSEADRPDSLLGQLEITAVEQAWETVTLPVTLPWQEQTLTVEFRGNLILVPPPDDNWAGAGRETFWRLLIRPWGEGLVTVTTDPDMFDNHRLADRDHARLLAGLVALLGPPETVWFQYLPRVPSLWQVLWRQAWMPLLGAVLALVALLLALGGRLGPMIPELPPQRRSLLEHIRASGRFLWRHRAGDTLVAAARQRVVRRLERRLTDWSRLEPEEQSRQAASLTGLDPAQARQALTGQAGDEAGFTQTLRLLQRMETHL